jgi:hypothetical protein
MGYSNRMGEKEPPQYNRGGSPQRVRLLRRDLDLSRPVEICDTNEHVGLRFSRCEHLFDIIQVVAKSFPMIDML